MVQRYVLIIYFCSISLHTWSTDFHSLGQIWVYRLLKMWSHTCDIYMKRNTANRQHSSDEINTSDAGIYARPSFIPSSNGLKDTCISLMAKPHICLCYQIIQQLWSAVNGLWHFSHFTPLLSSSFKNNLHVFSLSLTPKGPEDLQINHSWWNTSGDRQPPLRRSWFMWRFGRNPNSSLVKCSETCCDAFAVWVICVRAPGPRQVRFFSLSFFGLKMSGLPCVTGPVTNRIWGWGRGSFKLSFCVFFYVTNYHLLTAVSGEERGKITFFSLLCLSFSWKLVCEYKFTKCPLFRATAIAKIYKVYSWPDIKRTYSIQPFIILLYPRLSEDTWGVRAEINKKEHGVPLTLKIEVTQALYSPFRAKRQSCGGLLHRNAAF